MSWTNDVPHYQKLLTSDRPTDKAKAHFILASSKSGQAHFALGRLPAGSNQFPDEQRAAWLLASAVSNIASGLEQLSSGLRATYMLLEEVNRKLPK